MEAIMGDTVGIRELRDHLSELLREVAEGRTLRIQHRGRTVAVLAPASDEPSDEDFGVLQSSGFLSGPGTGPFGLADPPVVNGASVADAVIEDRR